MTGMIFPERKGPNPIEDPEGYRIYKRAQLEESIRVGGAMKPKFFVGVDVGRRGEFTAIAVVELPVFIPGRGWVRGDQLTEYERRQAKEHGGAWRREHNPGDAPLLVRDLQRLTLGASIVEILDTLGGLLDELKSKAETTLLVNATGAGDQFMRAVKSIGAKLNVREVVLTAGHKLESDKGVDSLPIKEIAETIRFLLDNGELKIAGGIEDGSTLLTELVNFTGRVRPPDGGAGKLLDWREGERDDLVLAVGLACFWARHTERWSASWGQRKRSYPY